MYLHVRFLRGFKKILSYRVSPDLAEQSLLGKLVIAPLKNRYLPAKVIAQAQEPYDNYQGPTKEIKDLITLPNDERYDGFLTAIASYFFIDPLSLYQRLYSFLMHKQIDATDNFFIKEQEKSTPTTKLTDEQQHAADYVTQLLEVPFYQPILLHGITGSGKTEVYKAIIKETINRNRTVIVLLPEVTLALQFQDLFKQQLPGIKIFGFHSATQTTEKWQLWQHITQEQPIVIIGVHLPILLPIANLGCIIIDEEHERGFQEKKHPKLNSKEVALWRAWHYQIPIILGSATPSLQSLYNVKERGWRYFTLTQRFSGSLPAIKKIILPRHSQKINNDFWLSSELKGAIKECMARHEQAIIYLNRRGHSFFVQCNVCSFIFTCPNCSVSLTLHIAPSDAQQVLRCHYCDFQQLFVPACPSCKATGKALLKKGIGTQQLVQILQKQFPSARIERADLDVTKKKGAWKKTVADFHAGNIDILVGTQTITKGYHFPKVSLVGIIWADLTLHLPLFNALETTLQNVIQVAGRAGRALHHGTVILQLMNDHSIFEYINERDYLAFASQELTCRKALCYPPYGKLIYLELKHKDSSIADAEAQLLAHHLRKHVAQEQLTVNVLGPSYPPIQKIQREEIRHIFLKSKSFSAITKLVEGTKKMRLKSTLHIVHQI